MKTIVLLFTFVLLYLSNGWSKIDNECLSCPRACVQGRCVELENYAQTFSALGDLCATIQTQDAAVAGLCSLYQNENSLLHSTSQSGPELNRVPCESLVDPVDVRECNCRENRICR